MVALLNSADIDTQRHDLIAEMEAILETATAEPRDLTDDETARIDEIQGSDGKGGLLAKLDGDFARIQAIETRKAQKIQTRINSGELELPAGEDAPRSIKVPARAKSSRNLRAFENQEDAFVSGQCILAGLFKNATARQWCSDHGFSNTMTEGDNSKGGFFVPDEMQRTLIRLREERGVFPRYARNYPMASDTASVPRDLSDVTAYWTGEGVEITASDASFGAAEMVAKKLACLSKVSSELDEDSVVDVAELITRSMAYSMADKIDEAGFNGDGTSTYGGVTGLKNALNASAIQDAASGNTGALTLDLADLEATVGKYPQYPGASPRWFVHSAVYWASMARLMDAGGGNRVQDLGSGPVMQFLGYPVTFTQVLPSTTAAAVSTILAYFGDLSLTATLGTRRSVRTQVSLDRYFENDLIGIKCTERVAVNVHERGDTIRTRPMVALKTAAS